jgi:hypothetical protein
MGLLFKYKISITGYLTGYLCIIENYTGDDTAVEDENLSWERSARDVEF